MTYNFKPGDVVQLKSGGPKMTVEMNTEDNDGVKVHCNWFIKNDFYEKEFNQDLLMFYKAPAVGVKLIRS